MNNPTETLDPAAAICSAPAAEVIALFDAIADQIGAALPCAGVREFRDEGLLQIAAAVERVGRRADALRVAAAAEIAERSRPELGTERLSAKKGCRTPSELVQRVTLVSAPTANRRMRLGAHVRTDHSIVGLAIPPKFPAIAASLANGLLGVDSVESILTALTPTLRRIDVGRVQVAETELVAAATGQGADTPVPATADETRIQALVWQAVLDPDGSRPDEDRALRERGFRLSRERGGLIPVSGALLPEIAGQFQLLFDAYLSPKTAPVAFRTEEEARADLEQAVLERDDRTPDQQRHDVLAVILGIAARSAETPSIGEAPPTVLISVRQQDLAKGSGVGWADGVGIPIALRAVKQMICTGGSQEVVIGPEGRIVGLGVPDRCFTSAQRRAITLRDGGCIIPGCHIPAAWCEIHHVIPDAQHGPTHTDNGVSLCWFHHRTIETSGWEIRMLRGVPQIKAPPWLDPGGRHWRTATKSPTRLADTNQPDNDG